MDKLDWVYFLCHINTQQSGAGEERAAAGGPTNRLVSAARSVRQADRFAGEGQT